MSNNSQIKFQTEDKKIDFAKYENGLMPAIVQDITTKNVLMLGFMNQEAFDKTLEIGRVTFYSRSKKRLWTKGETSGNFLELKEVLVDCDNDTLLLKAYPKGKVCHLGNETCFGNFLKENEIKTEQNSNLNFLTDLEKIISDRKNSQDEKSYIHDLFLKGQDKIAQKVGEEAVETVIEAVKKDFDKELFLNESADLLFHFLILLKVKGFEFSNVVQILKDRNKG
jgi:phosphoribosyl-ATP pyrophosphohydrolase/phosphoribosyl-AMP cyclohydrolase